MQKPNAKGSLHIKTKEATPHPQQRIYEANDGAGACPACNAAVKPGADICEACGTWLLYGQCRFCYSPFKAGQKFCGSCGNPPDGTACKACGTFTQFDFCHKCEAPVSRRAGPFEEQLLKSPELLQLQENIKSLSTPALENRPAETKTKNIQDELNAYFSQSEKKGSTTPAASSFHLPTENKDFSEQMQQSEQSVAETVLKLNAKNQEEAHRQIRELQERAFSSNQEARLYYMSIKHTLPKLNLNVCNSFLGWKCVYSGTIHIAGPADCACPSMGGHWVCNDGVKWSTGRDEFEYEGEVYTISENPEPTPPIHP